MISKVGFLKEPKALPEEPVLVEGSEARVVSAPLCLRVVDPPSMMAGLFVRSLAYGLLLLAAEALALVPVERFATVVHSLTREIYVLDSTAPRDGMDSVALFLFVPPGP